MGGSSGKKKKSDEPETPSVASNPNYIPMQQPQPFAPGMQEALASQLSAGYGRGGLLGTNDYTGLLNTIYSPQAIAADPIGVAQQAAAVSQQQKLAEVNKSLAPKNTNISSKDRMRDKR